MSFMSSTHRVSPVHRLLLIGALAMLAAMLLIPRVASQETQTLDLDVIFAQESIEVALAEGSPPFVGFPSRGDVVSAQGPITASGDADGERLGTFYFMGVGTALPEQFATAGNHLFATGLFEMFGQGSFVITGVASITQTSYLAITGGTGSYAEA